MQRIADVNTTFKYMKNIGVGHLHIAIQFSSLGLAKTKHVLQMDGDGGHTTMWIYLMPLKCT